MIAEAGISNPKFKSESYAQFGGLNTKFSPYVTSPLEFLDLQNFDFQQPGSLTQRWGTTQYFGQTAPGQINSLYEFSKLDGSSYVLFSYSGGIFSGATTGQSQGLSFTIQGLTLTYKSIVALNYPYDDGLTRGFYVQSMGANFQGDTNALLYGDGLGGAGHSFFLWPDVQSDNTLDYAILDNYLFAADGNKFFKFDGVTTTPVGLPPVLWATYIIGLPSSSLTSFGMKVGSTSSTSAMGLQFGYSFGIYYLYASYVNNRGFEGPIYPLWAFTGDNSAGAGGSLVKYMGNTGGVLQVSMMLATPIEYGISNINIYYFYDPYNSSIGQTYALYGAQNTTFIGNIQQRFWNLGPPNLLQSVPASGSTLTSFALGITNNSYLLTNSFGAPENTITNTYSPLGETLIGSSFSNQFSSYNTGGLVPVSAGLINYYPRYIETYSNRLFLAGFSLAPSTVWFSDLAEPEGYAPDFNFEVRTNDADVITSMVAYSTRLYIFKKNSFHVLSGDNPNDFFLQQVSDQYGCLNNRCAIIFGEILAFLDRKGVMTFNGSALNVLSIKVQPYFDNMNYNAAVNTACMVHDKIRNQILVAIPANGATINNTVLAYDYVANAWTSYTGLNPTVFDMIQGYNNTKYPLFGDLQGRVNWFGPSFIKDNGATMTTYFKTRFIHDIGDSIQKQFRRLYLNGDQQGQTLSIPINFYQDYGSSKVLSTTLNLGAFQDRIDYGISAKSLSFDATAYPTVKPLNIHGFTIEQRMQRRV